MIENLKIRPYQEGDEKGILTLMNAVYGQWHGLNYWRWKYKENPLGFFPNWIWMAESNGKIVGHYTVIPVRMKIGNKYILAAQSVDTATHPDYRRQGIFENLAKNVYAEAYRDGVRLIYGFANSPRRVTSEAGASYEGLHKKLEWTHLCFMTRMLKGLGYSKPTGSGIVTRMGAALLRFVTKTPSLGGTEDIEIEKIDKFDNGIDLFWEKVSRGGQVMTKRDSAYLNWRINDADSEYVIIEAKKGGEVQGYVILKLDREMGTGAIVDLLALPNRQEVVISLILRSLDFFAEQNVLYLRCWMMKSNHYHKLLKRLGWVDTPTKMGLLFRMNSEKAQQHEGILGDVNNWYITWLDSDHV